VTLTNGSGTSFRNAKLQLVAGDLNRVRQEIDAQGTPVSVEVNEAIGGTWRMLRSSHEWQKTAAWAAQFAVPVAANGTAVLKYRVRVTY
jgi:hypothetical protein